VRCFCLFIGYPRSGHSLVGSLVGAHPNAVIAHELDALAYVRSRLVHRDLLYSLIIRRDRAFGSAGRVWTGYEYSVPGQAQGRFEELLVFGDKRGGGTSTRLGRRPEHLDRLERLVGVDVHMVHVIRDPFDTIASMHLRGNRPLTDSVDRFFDLCATNDAIRRRRPGSVLDVRLDDLVEAPATAVRRLVGFLGLDAPEGYVRACSEVVFETPRRSRTSIEWPDGLVTEVRRRAGRYDFLLDDAAER
jgi:hypothetical protein